jgi:zeta-carotene desaturase
MSVIVIGGGLSGMSAALALSESGVRVTLLESSSRLGGRASSVYNKRLGMTIDLGQHALLGCCTNLLDFYRRIDATDSIEFHDSLAFFERDGIRSLKLSRLPEPLHLLPSLLSSASLPARDKLRASRLIGKPAHRSLEGLTASEWLRRLGQSPSSVKHFWEPVLVGALNENLDRAGAEYASMVVRLAMMGNREGFRMGVHRQPLSEANHTKGLRTLVNRDVDVHFGECAVDVERDVNSHDFAVRTRAGSEFKAERLVLAGGRDSSALFPPDVFRTRDDEAAMSKPVQVPIVTLYLWFWAS